MDERRGDHGDRRSRDGRDRRDGQSTAHPTPHAPFAGLIGRSRFVVLIAVASVLLVSVALFLVGAGLAVRSLVTAAVGLWHGELGPTELTVDMLEIVSVMLKAVVFYLIGVGFYSLFVAPLNLAAALAITSFNDLESKIVSVIVVIMAVTFLEHFIVWQQPVETLLFGVAFSVVVAVLVFFQMHSHKAAREDEVKDAPVRVRAQRRMFHQDEEEREVRPEEAKLGREVGPEATDSTSEKVVSG